MDHRVQFVKSVRDRLNAVGPGFCAMKWLHQTLYLHTGDNHSCYHPRPHHIPIDEIKLDPSALHNTAWKKNQRRTMLEGGRITAPETKAITAAAALSLLVDMENSFMWYQN